MSAASANRPSVAPDLPTVHETLPGFEVNERHYAGPLWESADGSRIVGALKERADAPLANAIPWLLLNAKSTRPEGAFSKVTSIQRVNTVGGVAPAASCPQASAGTSARIDYTADYYLFIAR